MKKVFLTLIKPTNVLPFRRARKVAQGLVPLAPVRDHGHNSFSELVARLNARFEQQGCEGTLQPTPENQ